VSDIVVHNEPNALLMRITNAVVRVIREYLGRGPTKARAYLSENVVFVITQDNLTKAEQRLVAEDEGQTVRELRRKFQTTMESDLVSAIETLTHRSVLTFLSDHDPMTDHGVEVFVLDGPPSVEPLEPS
jgi:uncharacterized protein YbcI